MNISESHQVSYRTIRELAIECFALSTARHRLFLQSEYDDSKLKTAEVFSELVSQKLLQLAISLRVKFYQGADYRTTSGFLEESGVLFKIGANAKNDPYPYTLKDVCDKIIHADQVRVIMDTDWESELIELWGERSIHGEAQHWVLSFSLPLVSKAVLEWIDSTAEA